MRAELKQALAVTPSQYSQHYSPKALLYLWATPVTSLAIPILDAETGESLEYRQLRRNPKHQHIWEEYYCNEIGRIYQGVGT